MSPTHTFSCIINLLLGGVNSHVGPVTPVIRCPRPIFLKDFELNVGGFGALLCTAFEKLGEIIDVLSVAVGEGRQVIGVPVNISKLRAATGEAQEVGGCYSLDMKEADLCANLTVTQSLAGDAPRRLDSYWAGAVDGSRSCSCDARRGSSVGTSPRVRRSSATRPRCRVRRLDCNHCITA